ncbi:hypothetical protein BH18ACT12_BH18ACT12_03700 [soil metagenome]
MQPSALVGRERELREGRELVSSNRLVTLTGPGGSGKTRLGLQAAAEFVEAYPDGVWFVSLAPVRDPILIEPTIAQIVGARDDLRDFLRSKKLLLLLAISSNSFRTRDRLLRPSTRTCSRRAAKDSMSPPSRSTGADLAPWRCPGPFH